MTKKINTTMMEINKPSELTQVVFIEGGNKKDLKLYDISPTEIDMINNFYYEIKKRVLKDNIVIPEDGSTVFEFQLKEISNLLGKYKNYEYQKIIDNLNSLSDLKMIINVLGKNKGMDTAVVTHFIQEIKISKHRNSEAKTVKLSMSNTLISSFINREKLFAKMFLKIQNALVSKYSKLLYEILKDYEGLSVRELDFGDLLDILNVTTEKQTKWLYFNQNILSKSINEINEKTDIKASYETIKSKPSKDERLQVTRVKFFIEKQSEERLEELGLIESPITSLPFYSKSKAKLDALVKGGYNVIDPDMWIETDIKKNEAKYDAETRLDNWLKDTPQDVKNEVCESLASHLGCDDPVIFIDSDYIIKGVFGKDALTKNAAETIVKLNEVLKMFQEENDGAC